MSIIINNIGLYFKRLDKRIFILVSLFTALLIYLNFHFGLEKWLTGKLLLPYPDFTGHYILFLFAFIVPYLLYNLFQKKNYFTKKLFIYFTLLAPAIFALKMSLDISFPISDKISWNNYWNQVIDWPLRLLIVAGILFFLWKSFIRYPSFYGLTTKQSNWKPYLMMLLIMVPLIAAASTQPDFLAVYPKMKMILPLPADTNNLWWYKLLFELSYGSDFVSIELFFRGFLVLAFVEWVGKDGILPMACFYCTIHFGKPLGECISSYFGGLLLGIIIYHTRSVLGGLMVHLGIAWLMELGGYIGNTLNS